MAENNEWKPMSGSRRFGIYTETIRKPERSGRKRCCLFGVIFAAGIIVVFLTVLSISTGKGRHLIRGSVTGIKVDDWTSTSKSGGINATEWAKTDNEPSIPRPDVSESEIRPLDSINVDDDVSSTADIFINSASDNSPPVKIDEAFASRQGRIINNPTNDFEIEEPPRFSQRPLRFENIPSTTGSSINSAFSFENHWNAFKGLKAVAEEDLKFAANDRQTVSSFPQVPAIKFTGVYVRGPPEEIDNMSLDNVDTHFNGHAYTSDPFKAYKPAHPSEINHLATAPSELDTGPRFSNKIRPTASNEAASGATSVGSFSQSVFFPQDSNKLRFPPVPGLQTISPSLPVDNRKPDSNGRPLKIMLDIYPVHPPSGIVNQDNPESERPVRINHPPRYQRQPTPPPLPSTPQPNRMIVHLNLFPRRGKKNSNPRQPTPYPVIMSFVPGGGRQFEDRISSEDQEEVEDTTVKIVKKMNPKTINGTSDVSIEIAETYRDDDFPNFFSKERFNPFKLPYDLIIGKERTKIRRKEIDADDFNSPIEEMKRRGKSKFDSTKKDDNRRKEEIEGEKNELKIVQFRVSSSGETIDERGIVRSAGTEGNIGSQITEVNQDGVYRERGPHLTKTDNRSFFSSDIDVNRSENYWKESDGTTTKPSASEGVDGDEKINKGDDKLASPWIETKEDGFLFTDDDDDDDDDDETFPIGTAIDSSDRLEMYITPPYNSGRGIEPRIDSEEVEQRMSKQINVKLPTSSEPLFVLPTSILPLPLEMTSPVSVKATESIPNENTS